MNISDTGEGYRLLWYGNETVSSIGKLFSMTLHVDEETEEGIYPISVYYAPENTVDEYDEVELDGIDIKVESAASIDISTLDVKLARYSYVYEGFDIEPAVTIDSLKEGEDYKVEYENNLKVGSATAIVTGIGDYTGSVSKNFTITQANIENADIEDIERQLYTGESIEPEPVISYNDLYLEKGIDFETEYTDNLYNGTATIIINGLGNFKGTVRKQFEISESTPETELEEAIKAKEQAEAEAAEARQAKEEAEAQVEALNEQLEKAREDAEANAQEIADLESQIEAVTKEKEEADQKLTEAEKAAQEAEDRIADLEEEIAQLKEDRKDLSMAKIEAIPDQTYNGKEIKPEVKVTYDGKTLEKKRDYMLSFEDNLNVGEATVDIIGIGNYSGIIEKKFNIIPKDIVPEVKLEITSYVYNGEVRTPEVVKVTDGTSEFDPTDYILTMPEGRKNVGKYVVKVEMTGNYSGEGKATFKINPKGTSISGLTTASKAITVKWKKQSARMSETRITGYQIQAARNSKFTTGKKIVTVKGYSITSKKITKLTSRKKYYVRVRTYKTVDGVKYYSKWSKVKTVTVK